MSWDVVDLEQRLAATIPPRSKQLSLASAAGVTVAAVSMWEAGKRVPAGRNLDRILRAFEQAGASREQVADLRWNWEEVKLSAAQRSTVDSVG